MLANYNYAVILSAYQNTLDTANNVLADTILQSQLNGMGLLFKPVIGCYEGKQEKSYIVFCDDYYHVASLEAIALYTYRQECVLVLDSLEQHAMLKYTSKVVMIGGVLQRANSADGLDNYTLVDGDVWVVV
jgi:hypothetical protein